MNPETKPGGSASRRAAALGRWRYFPRPAAWVVLVISLLASAGAWLLARQHAELEARKRFDASAVRITAALTERMEIYENVLHGAVGLFAASTSVERAEWHAYVESVSAQQRFPGIDGVGFAAHVTRAELEPFLQRTRADGAPDFTVATDQSTNDLIIVTYVEPEARHRALLGWDAATDPVRRAVAEQSARTRQAIMSRMTPLHYAPQDADQGCLMVLPVFRHDLPAGTLPAIEGWVFMRLIPSRLMEDLLRNRDPGLQFRVLDDGLPAPSNLVFDSDPPLTEQRRDQPARISSATRVEVCGRSWTLEFATKPSFEAASRQYASLWAGIVGAVISLLLFGIAWSLSHTRERALAMARNMTATLKDTNSRLQAEIREHERSQRRIAMQFAVTRVLAEAATLPEATAKIIQAVGESLDWHVGALWQLNAQKDRLFCLDFWRRPGLDVPEFEALTRRKSFPRGEGLPGRVWATAQPVWIADVQSDPNFPRGAVAVQGGLHSAFGFPVLMGGEFLGVLEFFSREITEPDTGLLSMMAATGSQVGQFIERKRSELKLEQERFLLRTLMDTVPDRIYFKDAQSRFLRVNTSLLRLHGFEDESSVLGKTDFDLFSEEHARQAFEDEQRVIATGEAFTKEEKETWTDGSIGWALSTKMPLRDEAGKIMGTFGISHDITEHRRAEEALRQSEARFQLMANTIEDVLYGVSGATGEFDYVSPAFERLLGYTLADVAAMGGREQFLTQVIQRGEFDEQKQLFDELQDSGPVGAPRRHEAWWRCKDGTLRCFEDCWIPLFSGKLLTGTYGVLRDITARKHAEEAMRKARDEAQEASRTKSQFLASMSHELRTPLNSVIGFANILLKNKAGRLTPADLNFLDRILANGKHLLLLINEVLDLSKIEARKVELRITPVSLDVLIRETVAQQESLVRDKPVQLRSELPPRLAPLMTDGDKLKQVIINLIGNALKFTEQGSVTVKAVADPAEGRPVRIDVIDTGIGIPADKWAIIFDAFQQAEEGTARKYGGTGLGLTISQALCELMGYRIEVTSRVGSGSTFSILLRTNRPADQPETPAARPAETAAAPAGDIQGRTILVIDDELDSRTLLTHMIEEFGCHAIAASSGEQGLHMAREFRPHLITVDLMMPQLDGWQVIRAIKADPALRDIPVVVVSIVAGENRGGILGAVDVLQKPVQREDLLAALQRALPGATPRILIVDDEQDAREVLAAHLEDEACEFRLAGNGQNALELLENFMPDLILLDLMMPVMDGMAFLKELRARPRFQWVPVVIVTAKELAPEELAQLRQSAQDVVKKGDVFEADLKSTLRRLLQAKPTPQTAVAPP
jgi:PAS domain S-box-containing protein